MRSSCKQGKCDATTKVGDLDDRSQLDVAFNGVDGVFSVQNSWLPNVGYDADIPALHKLHPTLLTLEQYLRKNGWENGWENDEPVPLPEQQQWS